MCSSPTPQRTRIRPQAPQRLERTEPDTWVDWQGIPAISTWKQEIFAAIEAADNFAFVISPDSVASDTCKEEVAHPAASGKRLIPIFLRPVLPGELPAPGCDSVDLIRADSFERPFKRMIEALDTDLEWKRAHTRILMRAKEWEDKKGHESFLPLV